jgi:isopenicillin-N epimerase
LVFPIKEVIAEARFRGIITIVDGAHAPGLIDLSLNDLNADFYSGNCPKWMMSPKGAAFLWARQDVQPMLEPLVVSHGWVAQSGGPQQKGAFGNTRFIDCFEVNGTRDPAAWLSLPEALKFTHDYDWPSLTQKSANLARQTADRIMEMTQIPLLASKEFSAPQMISVTLPDCEVENVKRKLYNVFNIEIPVFRWKEKSIVRISIQHYNTQEDANALISALKNIFNF